MGSIIISDYVKSFRLLTHKIYQRVRKIKLTKTRVVISLILLYILYLLISNSNPKTDKTTTQIVDFQALTQEDKALPTGFSYVSQSGVEGSEQITTEYTFKKNGALFSQRVVNQKEITIPVEKIVVSGLMPVEQFSNGLRTKAQAFYDKYKNGIYTGSSKYLAYVSGSDTIPFSDNSIKEAVKDAGFTIEEITVGQPTVHLPGTYYLNSELGVISADLPFQVKSQDFLHPDGVSEFIKTAYFDPKSHTWLFPPIGPVFSKSENISGHFSGKSAGGTATNGTLGVNKIIYVSPMSDSYALSDPNLSLEIIYTGTFDNGTAIKQIGLTDVRDDLGNVYTDTSSVGAGSDQTNAGQVVNTVSVDPKKIADAKKLSFKVTHVSSDATNSYSFFDTSVTDSYPQDFILTDISLR